jgi:hypothetical protein
MAMVNFHSARVRDPDEFKEDAMAIGDKFATMQLSPGVSMLIGIPKGKTTTFTQAYRFDADEFTPDQAKAWLKTYKINYIDFEEASKDNPKKITSAEKRKRLILQAEGLERGAKILENRGYDEEAKIARDTADKMRDEISIFHEENPEETEKPKSPKPEARSPKPKKNPRPPLWQDKTFIATQGIGGLIYFGYKDPPTEFKTKKARREYGRRLYNKYRAFLKKFNLKADETLSGQRKAAYEHGGTKKLKARAKRTSTLLNPKAASGRDKKNPSKAQPKSQSTPEIAAARAYKYFTDGRNPTKALKVRRPRKRTVFIKLARGVDITHSDDQYEYAYRLGGKKINWDLENNAIIIFVPELDKILGNDVKKPHDSPVSFNKRDRNAAEKIFRTFQGKKPKKLEYRTMENKSLCVEINKALAIRYRSDKYGGSPNQLYKHPFGDAIMYCDIGNSAIVIMGHNLEITKTGIEG